MKFPLAPRIELTEYHSFFALRPRRCAICDVGFWLERGFRKMVLTSDETYYFEYSCSEHHPSV